MVRFSIFLPVATTTALAVTVGLNKLLEGDRLSAEDNAKVQKLLQRYRDQLLPNDARLVELEKEFIAQMRDGLKKFLPEPVDGKRMLMIPTYVSRLPDGTETGDCFALDLGGTNFRVMHCKLGGSRGELKACVTEEVSLPKDVYTGPGEKLFNFLAVKLASFIDRQRGPFVPANAPPPVVGFCFSFAVHQTSINSGNLLGWTKGFTCPGVVGKDPVALLDDALKRAGRPCRIAVLLNDTVGVLAAQRYLDSDTEVGVILGTGTNACYVENIPAVAKWAAPEGAVAAGGGRTAINMEWGAFFSPQLPRCMEDLQVDAASPNPGMYLFEKLLSGMWLGETARCILVSLARDVPQLFRAKPPKPEPPVVAGAPPAPPPPPPPPPFSTKGCLTSELLSKIVGDKSIKLLATRWMLASKLGVHKPSRKAAQVVQEVCMLVSRRAAELTAMALIAMLKHSGWKDASIAAVKAAAAAAAATAAAAASAGPGAAAAVTVVTPEPPRRVTVAFDGGVYERFAAFRDYLDEAMKRQLGEHGEELMQHVCFALCHDGSALGAAVLAAAEAHAGTK